MEPTTAFSNTILTALPFLRISPDARSGAMGDAGVSLTADPAAMHHNAARLAFCRRRSGSLHHIFSWLRNLGIDDIFLLYLSGFKKLDDNQALGLAVRYLALVRLNLPMPMAMTKAQAVRMSLKSIWVIPENCHLYSRLHCRLNLSIQISLQVSSWVLVKLVQLGLLERIWAFLQK